MGEADLFEQALAIEDPGRRAEFLDRVCAGDAALKARLERLLAVHDEGTGWPDHSLPAALGLEAGTSPDANTDGVPADLFIDGIRIVRFIGEGGFGRVYEGWQENAGRRVAVKVLRPDRLDREAVARFERETRLLGRLSHPGIAAVLASGLVTTPQGRLPFLVTEHVDGARRLTEHAAGLDLAGRLTLLAAVCRAVGHAHERGVVHRDLKPGNILVGADGRAKVIDFGWACRPEGDFTQVTALTMPGMIAGTWQYMSPEQFDTEGRRIDARVDVWALGVIAYQLLAGRMPYDVRGLPLPGIVALVSTVRVPTLVSVDDTIPLPLSLIVDKCLQNDPARRYADAGAMADELERFAAGEAVRARGPTFAESIVQLVRRHPAGSAAMAGLFLGLLIAVLGISRGALVALEARRAEEVALAEAERGRDEARANRKIAAAEREAALHRVYSGNLLRIGQAAEDGDTPEARSLLAESIDIAARLGIEGRDAEERPLELRCAEATVEGALAVLSAHAGGVADLACSPDGKWLVSCGRTPGWRLWDGERGALVAEAEAGGPAVRLVQFSSDGRVFATVDETGALQIRDSASGALRFALVERVRVDAGIVFSPDGSRLLTAGTDRTCRLWNVVDGTLAGSLAGHRRHVTCMAWSPDGNSIATATADTVYRLWNAADGTLLATREPHGAVVSAIAFSPDSTLLATGSVNGSLRLWRYRERADDIVLDGHQWAIRCLAFSPDGALLATGSRDRTLRLWNVVDGSPRGRPAAHDADVIAVAFSPDSTRAISGGADGTVGWWDTIDAKSAGYLLGHSVSISALTVLADGDRIVTAGADGEIRVWQGDVPAVHHAIAIAREPIDFVQFAADSRRLAVGTRDGTMAVVDTRTDIELSCVDSRGGRWKVHACTNDLGWMAAGSQRGSIRLWNEARGIDRLVGAAHGEEVSALAFSPDGRRLVSGALDGSARLWDPESGEPIAGLGGHAGDVNCAATSPDGTMAATGADDGTVRVWSLTDGALIAVCDVPGGAVFDVAFGRDSDVLAVARYDGSLTIHDPRQGTLLARRPSGLGRVRSVVFSPDGKWLATTHRNPTTKIWDTSDWSVSATLPGHNVQTGPAVFSPDGARVIVGGSNGTVRVWDHARASVLFVAKSHPLTILSTAVSPDGRLFVSGGADGVVKIHGRTQGEVFAEWQRGGETGRVRPGPARIGEKSPPPLGNRATPANPPSAP